MQKGFEKRFNTGDIVYWCHQNGNKYTVKYGMVDEQFSDAVCIDYLHLKEDRLIDGVPIKEFPSMTKYRKLPKGWSYDTQLFEITLADVVKPITEKLKEQGIDFNPKNIKIDDPEGLKKAYEYGYLVKDETIYHGNVEAEIDKEGYRIVKKYPMWVNHISRVSVRPDKVYYTYAEAQKDVDAKLQEFERQSNLSDYDWSIEQIDKVLNMWAEIYSIPEDIKLKHRRWLLDMDRVEDIDVRISIGNLQWKYDKNKKWNNIEF
jgi:hypothetical protein